MWLHMQHIRWMGVIETVSNGVIVLKELLLLLLAGELQIFGEGLVHSMLATQLIVVDKLCWPGRSEQHGW